MRVLWLLPLLLAPAAACAAGRPRVGGTLRVALTEGAPAADPWLSDVPSAAATLLLERAPLCRLPRTSGEPEPAGAGPLTENDSGVWTAELRDAKAAAQLVAAWERLRVTPSPYRALLAPLRSVRAQKNQLLLTPAHRWPDLVPSLCHPALAAAPGPYRRSGRDLVADPSAPRGRPFPDRARVEKLDARTAERRLALGELDVVLGGAAPAVPLEGAPALFTTYLAFRPGAVGPDFRKALASIDREALARDFARAPATALASLLPPPLLPAEPLPPAAAPPPALAASRTVELLFDAALTDQAAVAERLQVLLHALGYQLSLVPLPRAVLYERWAAQRYGLMLVSVLLPPLPSPAFAVAVEAAGRHDLLPLELPALGAISEAGARAARVKMRAAALLPVLSLFPLYFQGPTGVATAGVAGMGFDAHGVPSLDDVSLEVPPPQPEPGSPAR